MIGRENRTIGYVCPHRRGDAEKSVRWGRRAWVKRQAEPTKGGPEFALSPSRLRIKGESPSSGLGRMTRGPKAAVGAGH